MPPVGAAVAGEEGPSPTPHGKIRIVQICDPQFGFITANIPDRCAENHKKYYAEDLAAFKKMIPAVNAENADLVVIAGDLVQFSDELRLDWPVLLKQFTAPVLIVPGNHDLGVWNAAHTTYTSNTAYEQSYRAFVSFVGYGYASRVIGNWRIVGMNSQFWQSLDGSTYMNEQKAAHKAWYDAEIAAAKSNGQGLIVVSHVPPFETSVGDADTMFNFPSNVRTTMLNQVLDAGGTAWLAGHSHLHRVNTYGDLKIYIGEAMCANYADGGHERGYTVFEVAEGSTEATWRDVTESTWGKEEGEDLPSGYLPLQYIESDGYQYIDTEVKIDSKTDEVEIDFEMTDYSTTSANGIFGSRIASDNENYTLQITSNADILFGCRANNSDTSHQLRLTNATVNTRYIFRASKDLRSLTVATNPQVPVASDNSSLVQFSSQRSAYLFWTNKESPAWQKAKMRLYGCKISRSGSLQCDLVPVLQLSDCAVGVYDRAARKFRGSNDVNHPFIAGPVAEEEDIEELAYIEADGNQYIDTLYHPNANSEIYFKYAASDIENNLQLFGCVSGSNRLRCQRRNSKTGPTDGIVFIDMTTGAANNINGPKVLPDTAIHEIIASNALKKYDDVEMEDTTEKPLTAEIGTSLCLMKFNSETSSTTPGFAGRVYAFRVTEGETVKVNLVPARTKESGVIGLYDRVSGHFLANAGTGNFKGPSTVDVKWRGQQMTVCGTSSNPAQSLVLCWGPQDGGTTMWTHQTILGGTLPVGDFEETFSTAGFGIGKHDIVRVFIGTPGEAVSLVEWVQTDGTKSYFDTCIKADCETSMSLDGACLTTSAVHLFSCCASSGAGLSQAIFNFGVAVRTDGTFGFCQNDNSSMDFVSTVERDTERHLFENDAFNKTVSLDGKVKKTFEGEISHTTAGSVFLGARANVLNDLSTTPAQYAPTTIYSFTTKKRGEVVQHLLPSVENGVAGLYDTVTGAFLAPEGAGTVTASAAATGTVHAVYNTSASAAVTRLPDGMAIILR